MITTSNVSPLFDKCCREAPCIDLMRPFVQGGRLYATDLRIAVRAVVDDLDLTWAQIVGYGPCGRKLPQMELAFTVTPFGKGVIVTLPRSVMLGDSERPITVGYGVFAPRYLRLLIESGVKTVECYKSTTLPLRFGVGHIEGLLMPIDPQSGNRGTF